MDDLFSLLTVFKDHSRRQRLKTIFAHDQGQGKMTYRKIRECRNLSAATSELKEDSDYDVVLFSDEFSKEETGEFIEFIASNHEKKIGSIIVFNNTNPPKELVAYYRACGCDKIFFEPFSVESLSEIIKLVEQIWRENSASKKEQAVKLLMELALDEVNIKAAELRTTGERSEYSSILKSAFALCEKEILNSPSHYVMEFTEAHDKREKERKDLGLPTDQELIYSGVSRRVHDLVHKRNKLIREEKETKLKKLLDGVKG